MHKNQNLTFKKISVGLIRSMNCKDRKCIYKSKSYNRQQSSQYFVAKINGKAAFVRISNHWGKFSTQPNRNQDGWEQMPSKSFNWVLKGGEHNKKSQAGYFFIQNS